MFKKSYFVISLWVVLGSLSGLFFSSFYGKTNLYIPFYHNISNVLERTSPSVVNIWTIKKWRGWQEQSNEFGFKFNRRVIELTIMQTIDKLSNDKVFKNILPHNYDERHLKTPSSAYE